MLRAVEVVLGEGGGLVGAMQLISRINGMMGALVLVCPRHGAKVA